MASRPQSLSLSLKHPPFRSSNDHSSKWLYPHPIPTGHPSVASRCPRIKSKLQPGVPHPATQPISRCSSPRNSSPFSTPFPLPRKPSLECLPENSYLSSETQAKCLLFHVGFINAPTQGPGQFLLL